MHLYEVLAPKVADWRQKKHFHEQYPAISEILEWARKPDVSSFQLRPPQVRALETYWYLRLIEKTPHIFDLYSRYFAKTTERMAALGMEHTDLRDLVVDMGFDGLISKIRTEDAFVKQYHLEAFRETLNLEYPSYILALAMGAGKTVLIGAIFASEFAMAQEYPDGRFVENALVFAPGKTIGDHLGSISCQALHITKYLPLGEDLWPCGPGRGERRWCTTCMGTIWAASAPLRSERRMAAVLPEQTSELGCKNRSLSKVRKSGVLRSVVGGRLSLYSIFPGYPVISRICSYRGFRRE